jgi:WD40 repeat protein
MRNDSAWAACIWLLAMSPSAFGQDTVRVDALGDPLPPFAVARFGTQRLRHDPRSASIAFSPDGKKLATVGGDLRIWDVATGKLIRAVPVKHSVKSIDIAADGTLIAAGVFTDAVYLFDSATGAFKTHIGKLPWGREVVGIGDIYDVRSIALAVDGKTFAAPFIEEKYVPDEKDGKDYLHRQPWIKWFDASTGKPVHEVKLEPTYDRPRFIALSSDDRLFACVGDKGKVVVWNRERGEPIVRIDAGEEHSLCAAFSIDGSILATGSGDKRVHLWDPKTGRQVRDLDRHGKSVLAVTFMKDKKRLASLSRDRICLWNVADGGLLREFVAEPASFIAMAIAPQETHLAAIARDGTIRVWTLGDGQLVHPIDGHRARVNALAVSADGKSLVSGGDDAVLVWDLSRKRVVTRLETTAERIALLPEGSAPESRVLIGNTSRPPEVWDIAPPAGKRLRVFEGPALSQGLRLSPDGKHAATLAWVRYGSKEEVPDAYLWDVEKGTLCQRIGPLRPDSNRNVQWAIAFSADSKLLAIGGNNARVMRVPDCTGVVEIAGTSNGLAFAPDGKRIASRWNRLATIFDLETGKKRSTLGDHEWVGLGAERPIAFSPDGRTLAIGNDAGDIFLGETATGWERGRFEGHRGSVHALAFSADGTRLYSAGEDSTILLWELAGREPMDLPAAWNSLASGDGPTSCAGIERLCRSPKEALALVNSELSKIAPVSPSRVRQLIAELGNADFNVRNRATHELEATQESYMSMLREALAADPEPEVSVRIRKLLSRADPDRLEPGSERLRWIRALEVLERIGTPEAFAIVRELAAGPADRRLTAEAKSVLRR